MLAQQFPLTSSIQVASTEDCISEARAISIAYEFRMASLYLTHLVDGRDDLSYGQDFLECRLREV